MNVAILMQCMLLAAGGGVDVDACVLLFAIYCTQYTILYCVK